MISLLLYLLQYTFDCDDIDNLPSVTITLSGQDYLLEPKDYIVKVRKSARIGELNIWMSLRTVPGAVALAVIQLQRSSEALFPPPRLWG